MRSGHEDIFISYHAKDDVQSTYAGNIVWQRRAGDPLRVYMDLEPSRMRSGHEDIFISYHAKDDVQSTYAGALFHNNRNYHLSSVKNNDTLPPQRNQLAKSLLRLLPHHSFGKFLNNVGGLDQALSLYPKCMKDANESPKWWDHLHCANTLCHDFVPPHSIIDGKQFGSMEELAIYVKALANDPVAYAEYQAWRRCGVLGNYRRTRAASLDTLPCRLCEAVEKFKSLVKRILVKIPGERLRFCSSPLMKSVERDFCVTSASLAFSRKQEFLRQPKSVDKINSCTKMRWKELEQLNNEKTTKFIVI
ncbi:unnamed protein product [Fraxinus pennsylvanica]|uniref:Fucosyltransferase n=1 Tax=Fraxinus pennsylvanica TaxID=56036 RepID=A0AAD1Z6J6_9LAMI|nr:unnamed protein product [Fraxinus pennsylvanica]